MSKQRGGLVDIKNSTKATKDDRNYFQTTGDEMTDLKYMGTQRRSLHFAVKRALNMYKFSDLEKGKSIPFFEEAAKVRTNIDIITRKSFLARQEIADIIETLRKSNENNDSKDQLTKISEDSSKERKFILEGSKKGILKFMEEKVDNIQQKDKDIIKEKMKDVIDELWDVNAVEITIDMTDLRNDIKNILSNKHQTSDDDYRDNYNIFSRNYNTTDSASSTPFATDREYLEKDVDNGELNKLRKRLFDNTISCVVDAYKGDIKEVKIKASLSKPKEGESFGIAIGPELGTEKIKDPKEIPVNPTQVNPPQEGAVHHYHGNYYKGNHYEKTNTNNQNQTENTNNQEKTKDPQKNLEQGSDQELKGKSEGNDSQTLEQDLDQELEGKSEGNDPHDNIITKEEEENNKSKKKEHVIDLEEESSSSPAKDDGPGYYSLSEFNEKIVNKIEEQQIEFCFVKEPGDDYQIGDDRNKEANINPHITVRYVDPKGLNRLVQTTLSGYDFNLRYAKGEWPEKEAIKNAMQDVMRGEFFAGVMAKQFQDKVDEIMEGLLSNPGDGKNFTKEYKDFFKRVRPLLPIKFDGDRIKSATVLEKSSDGMEVVVSFVTGLPWSSDFRNIQFVAVKETNKKAKIVNVRENNTWIDGVEYNKGDIAIHKKLYVEEPDGTFRECRDDECTKEELANFRQMKFFAASYLGQDGEITLDKMAAMEMDNHGNVKYFSGENDVIGTINVEEAKTLYASENLEGIPPIFELKGQFRVPEDENKGKEIIKIIDEEGDKEFKKEIEEDLKKEKGSEEKIKAIKEKLDNVKYGKGEFDINCDKNGFVLDQDLEQFIGEKNNKKGETKESISITINNLLLLNLPLLEEKSDFFDLATPVITARDSLAEDRLTSPWEELDNVRIDELQINFDYKDDLSENKDKLIKLIDKLADWLSNKDCRVNKIKFNKDSELKDQEEDLQKVIDFRLKINNLEKSKEKNKTLDLSHFGLDLCAEKLNRLLEKEGLEHLEKIKHIIVPADFNAQSFLEKLNNLKKGEERYVGKYGSKESDIKYITKKRTLEEEKEIREELGIVKSLTATPSNSPQPTDFERLLAAEQGNQLAGLAY